MHPRIHDRYLLLRFLRIFVISVIAFLVIFITVNIFEEIDNFIDHDARMVNIVRFYIYSVPYVLSYVVPVSLLLGTVFAMGLLARRNELTALLASGVSLIRVAMPIFAFSLVVALASIYFNDSVVTSANRKKNDIKRYDIEGRSRVVGDVKADFRYLGSNGFVYLAQTYSHENQTLYDVVVQEFDGNQLVRRIDARDAVWTGDHWRFSQGYTRSFGDGQERIEAFDTLAVREISETPDDFAAEEISEEDMNLGQLRHYIERVRRSGGKAEKYLVDMHFKFSFPFAGTIFVVLGVALASGKRKPSIATGFGLTLVIAFIYYALLRVGQTLGHNGLLPPLLAAQLGNIVFLAIGGMLLKRANK